MENNQTPAHLEDIDLWLPIVDPLIAARGGDVPVDFDRLALAHDLDITEFMFGLRLIDEERPTELDAQKLMLRAAIDAKRFRLTMEEISKHDNVFRHLAEEINGWAADQPPFLNPEYNNKMPNPAIADFDFSMWTVQEGEKYHHVRHANADEYLSRVMRCVSVIEQQSNALATRYSKHGKEGGRHSRSFAGLHHGTRGPEQWLVGERLPALYLKYFKRDICDDISHSGYDRKNKTQARTGLGMDFLYFILWGLGVYPVKEDNDRRSSMKPSGA